MTLGNRGRDEEDVQHLFYQLAGFRAHLRRGYTLRVSRQTRR
jgi:hypothetical protein